MKNTIFLFLALIFGTTTIAGIKEPLEKVIDLNGQRSDLDSYRLSVRASVTPLGVFSSIAVVIPVKLQINCEGKTLGEASFLYNRNLKNSEVQLSTLVENFELRCPSLTPEVVLQPNGIELKTSEPFFSYELNSQGLSLKGIAESRPKKAEALVKIVSNLSQLGGSEESFNCLIQGYLTDPIMTGPVESITNEYEKIYGPFDSSKFICPAAAEGALARNVTTCETDPTDLSMFCLIYARYKDLRTWFDGSILRLQEIQAETDSELADMKQAIQELEATLRSDIESKERILTLK